MEGWKGEWEGGKEVKRERKDGGSRGRWKDNRIDEGWRWIEEGKEGREGGK